MFVVFLPTLQLDVASVYSIDEALRQSVVEYVHACHMHDCILRLCFARSVLRTNLFAQPVHNIQRSRVRVQALAPVPDMRENVRISARGGHYRKWWIMALSLTTSQVVSAHAHARTHAHGPLSLQIACVARPCAVPSPPRTYVESMLQHTSNEINLGWA